VATFAMPVGDTVLAGERWAGDPASPAIVLLHAGVADRRSWREVAEQLAALGGHVVAYDRRGFGETPARSPEFRHVDDLLAVLDETTDGPAWLVGSSQGGLLALDLALSHPERVAGLVLLAPAVSGAPEPEDDDLDPATRRLSDAIDDAYEAGRLDELNRLEVALWLDGPAAVEGRVGGAARTLALDMNAIALRSDLPEDAGTSGLDAWSRLDELRVPATLAWGDLDLPIIIDRCRELAERLPAVREKRVLHGTAHLPYLEQPQAVAQLIGEAVGLPTSPAARRPP
jgi:pimeloyl-ACP methyl ester carboxylesterase